MKEKRMLELFGNIDENYIEEASPKQKKRPRLQTYRLLAACLCLLLIGGAAFSLFTHPSAGDKYYTTTMGEIASIYDGILLAEKLPFAGAKNTNIQLCYRGDGKPLYVNEWKVLSVSASFDTYDVTMECAFNGETFAENTEQPVETLSYGDIPVCVYRRETEAEYEASYYAAFTYDGVSYQIRTNSHDPKIIYEVLQTVLGEPNTAEENTKPEDAPPRDTPQNTSTPSGKNTFTDVLGYNGYYVKIEETAPGFIIWKYYAETEGKEKCIAEVFGYAAPPKPEAYSVDLDGDGIKELICNCIFGTGAQRVYVYRNHQGVIEKGRLSYDPENREMFPGMFHWGANAINERYNPEKGVFEIEYAVEGEMEMAVTVLELNTDIQFEVFVEEP